MRKSPIRTFAPLRALITGLALLSAASCGDEEPAVRGIGDPQAGIFAIGQKACGSCHDIPGIAQADGTVGPPLEHFASRQMIVGELANSPENLIRYLQSPQSVVKGNAMPDQGLSAKQARDIAAYLFTLR